MNPVRTPIRRWASHLPDGLVTLYILLLGLLFASLLMAAITVILAQFLRLAGGNENWILIIHGIIFVLGIVLVFPMIVVFACLVKLLEELVGTRCPSCHRRELEWRSGNWKYGDQPDYQYFACANCGARFRQLCGGQGVLSELERV
jgi:Transcription factor S-II (TFIIS)